MNVQVVRTPTDMRDAMTMSSRTHFISIPDDMEPNVRHATDDIFKDLPYIDSSEPDLLAVYLDGIEEPLARLRAMGLQLVAVSSKGSMQVPRLSKDAIPWTNTDFVIAPAPCFFREEVDGALVHALGSRCADGHRVFTKNGAAVATWPTTESVERGFTDERVPWCATCLPFIESPACVETEAKNTAQSVMPEPTAVVEVETQVKSPQRMRSRVARVLNHPWVAGVGSGVLLIALTALITYLFHH